MAEYITKEQIISILYAPRKEVLTFEDFVKSIGNLTPADVIERSKIDKAITELQNMKVYDRTKTARLVSLPEVFEILKKNIGE